MEINNLTIREFLKKLKFQLKDGEELTFIKRYENGYEIKIYINENNFSNSRIDYGKKIKVHRETTSNFSQQENFVILECVNRLLEKGYFPEDIELEKVWNLGHKGKGFLDIWIKDKSNKSFLMIECKNWGNEYEKEKRNTLDKSKSGSQLFSYLQQEPKNTKAICLYTSKFENNNFDYKTSIIYNKDEWIELNQEERFLRWSEAFEDNGIFEEWVEPYFLNTKSITRGQLKKLTKEDGENIYNKFAEILRHNVISDKSNAFNKIINLFLCKIYDEDRNEDEEVKFQIRTKNRLKEDEELLSDLSDLYKQGMINYLNKNIVDYTLEELQEKIKTKDDTVLLDVYRKLRLYKDNDFAFREVFDEKSFKDNAKVVREVVELLQDKQIRYSHKQQFLGDFFEKLLKDSIKQESGQFFTPVPITQFIIKSLPISDIIENKISSNEEKIIPYVIDYACGSGHFLTEIMDELNVIIKTLDENKIQKPSLKKQIKSWKTDDFLWANEYIYGIDLDYRLVKTSKISCFLNGDGLAQVIHADGLDNFKSSEIYPGVLKSKIENKDNQKFDILVSNPPYSVKAFRNTLNDGEKSFELYNNITDDSKEIECLFVERAKQLLKNKGVIGIVLPISILTNSGIYERTREIIFKNFNIKAIVSLGSNAFMATGTKTIILFMERRSEEEYTKISKLVNLFFENYKEVTINNMEKPISTYLKETYSDINFEDYLSLLKNTPNEKLTKSEIFGEYKNITHDKVKLIEKEKILYFILSYSQKIIVADSGEKDEEKEFYGYEFSERRGLEGIHPYRDKKGNIISKLYNQLDNKDPLKLNSYILKLFQNKEIDPEINEINNSENHPLKEHIHLLPLSRLINFNSESFDKSINLYLKKKININKKEDLNFNEFFKYNRLVSLSEISIIQKGTPITKEKITEGNVPVIAGGQKPAYYHNKSNRNGNIITVSASGAYSGFVSYYSEPIFASDSNTIKSKNEKDISTKLIYYFLKFIQEKIYHLQKGKAQPHVYGKDLERIKIPLPSLDTQEKIIKNMEKLEKGEKITKLNIKILQDKIIEKYKILDYKSDTLLKLSDSKVFDVSIGKRVISKDINQNKEGIPVYSANVFEPFGFINKKLLKNFDKPSILWGIDGDWMVNYIEGGKEFYPTDHCGVLRVDENKISSKYMVWLLKNEGNRVKFSRNYRASINRIKSLSVKIPSLLEQNKVIKEIESIEKEIKQQEECLEQSKKQKEEILKKYLK